MSTSSATALQRGVLHALEIEPSKPSRVKATSARSYKRPAASRRDPELIFILARQSVLRWEFAAARMRRPNRPSEAPAFDLEISLALEQLRAVVEQLRPLTRSRNMAVRFEAEEELLRVRTVAQKLEERQQECFETARHSGRTALEVQEALLMKLKARFRR